MEAILEAIAGKQKGIIAIDGPAAAGKSTLAAKLKHQLGAEIVHMDDFFLPSDLRTPQRINQPGGNVHYERFLQEVLPFLKSGEAFSYRIFDCSIMDYGAVKKISNTPWRIVEGVYSHHPFFGVSEDVHVILSQIIRPFCAEYINLRVFLDIDKKTQMERIIRRNGREKAEMFKDKWIPLEDDYFLEFGIRDKADVLV